MSISGLMPVPWTTPPPPMTPLAREGLGKGVLAVWMPAWDQFGQSQTTGSAFVHPRSGVPWRFVQESPAGNSDLAKSGAHRAHITAPAAKFTPTGVSNFTRLRHTGANTFVEFPDKQNLAAMCLTYYRGQGASDDRIFSKDLGSGEADHDLMIGSVGSDFPRLRIRLGTSTVSVAAGGGDNPFQVNALNVIAGGIQRTSSTQGTPRVRLLRQDNATQETSGSASSSSYNPRTTTTVAFGSNAGADTNSYDGDIFIWVALDHLPSFQEMRDFMRNPWQIFEPDPVPFVIPTAGGPVAVSPADVTQLQVLDAPSITQDHQLSPGEVNQLQVTDAVTVSQDHQLSPGEVDQLQVADAATITQDHQLSPGEVDQLQVIDAVTLVVEGTVQPVDVDQLQVLDAVVLTQDHQLSPGEVDQLQVADAATITQDHQLSPNEVDQLQVIDGVVLVLEATLTPNEVAQLQALDGVQLLQDHQLSPAELTQLQFLGAPTASIPSDFIAPGRAVFVVKRDRLVAVVKRIRAMQVDR